MQGKRGDARGEQLTLFSGPATPPVDPRYDHVWYWGRPSRALPPYEPQRKGRRCRVRCRGNAGGPLNVAVEMADGELVCAPRRAVRRAGGQSGGSGRGGKCTCVLADIGSYPVGWSHDRGCPRYERPPAELMATAWRKHDRESLAWLFRHWDWERYPRDDDFCRQLSRR